MASASLRLWRTEAIPALDEIAAAHRAVGGRGRGRRWTTQQINYAYLVILASRFQEYCRNVHSETADVLAGNVANPGLARIFRARLIEARQLDRGNAQPASLGADFGRFGLGFWASMTAHDPSNARRQIELQSLNDWRNAIVHQDFTKGSVDGQGRLPISRVRQFRRTCQGLAASIDRVLSSELLRLTGRRPW